MIAYENNQAVNVFYGTRAELSAFWGTGKIYPDEEPYTLTMTPDGWTGFILVQQFSGNPKIAVNPYSTSWGIYVQGYVLDNINGWAQFGFEKEFETRGCKYVDIRIPYSYGAYSHNGNLGGDISIDGKIVIQSNTVIPTTDLVRTVPISGDTITLRITINSFGGKNIYAENKLQSLYFHS